MAKRVYGVEKAISIIAAVASAGSPKEAKLELASGGSKVTQKAYSIQSKFMVRSHKLMSPDSTLNPNSETFTPV